MVFGSSPANAAIRLLPPRPSKADRRPPTHRCCRSSRRANTSATCSDQSPLTTAVVAVMTEPSMGRSMALKTCRSIIYWVFSGNRNYTLPKFDSRTKLSEQVEEVLRRGFPEKAFRTVIKVNVELIRAQIEKKSIFAVDPDSTGAKDYENLIDEILHREQSTKVIPILRRSARGN